MRFLKNSSGFTLVEVLHASFILGLIVTAMIAVSISTMRMDMNTAAESLLFSEGMKIMSRVERGDRGRYGLMKARSGSVTISNGGARVDFSVDTNTTYTDSTADDVAMSLYYDNGDGDDLTYRDNVIQFNDGTNLTAIGTNVETINFSQNSSVVTVALTVIQNVEGQAVRMNLSRDILTRN